MDGRVAAEVDVEDSVETSLRQKLVGGVNSALAEIIEQVLIDVRQELEPCSYSGSTVS